MWIEGSAGWQTNTKQRGAESLDHPHHCFSTSLAPNDRWVRAPPVKEEKILFKTQTRSGGQIQRWTQNYALKVIKDAPQALWRHAPTYMLHWEFQNLECECKSGQVDSFHVCFTSVLRSRFGVQRAWPMLKANYDHRTIEISTPWMSLSVDACVLLWSLKDVFL